MTLQEIITSLDDLSVEDKTSLFNVLESQLSQIKEEVQENPLQNKGDSFWEGVLRFRETIEREGIEFTDEDFANLRDRSPGREVEL
ncbi:hypothetical protein MEN41_13225 [Dolichospermum sp. ST_con]|jgi:hypothetical protein|nr:hypothetical protein [Dolichospermum sp. ST_con]MDD1420036.1 hypothetical protein [Dolichospermum sp. ST_sed1]MDD1425690.1 hypothetical protein [Dolichospermum sp. ST_sed9]MDD1432224.1 hypothetical protein [Dolichospermum sp. ST_sed6]MDD1441556.1 hypothetical protein [Dolichospermum sp. ST_sed3]MDD1447350.1 hypothetical protein [Dolichospermum sp. ST_sed8]MDD1455706.1 hypothetical protein [Dolichospermum sp. ST_sed7]MDD1461511.1 hypothetical protein [Dolichospermum sp. ST_sed2]MDD1465313